MTRVAGSAVCGALCLLLLGACHGKLQTGAIRLGGEKPQWQYISKFGYGIGEGDYAVRVRLLEPVPTQERVRMDFDIYLDEDWGSLQSLPDCEQVQSGKSRRHFRLDVPADGSWGQWSSGGVYQVVRPHIWYFTLSDCDHDPSFRVNASHLVEFELHAIQAGGDEFGVEMKYMFPANLCALCIFTGFLMRYAWRCHRFWQGAGSIHVVILALTVAIMLQYVGQLLHTLHLWKYRQDGIGAKHADALSEILFMLSQVTQTSLLIIIALGYTLLHSSTKELELVKPITLAISVVHALLVAYGKLHDDASFKYHEYEGFVGWALLIIRLGLYAWFIVALQALQQKGGFRLQPFLQEFQVAGSVYFLSYPVIFTSVQVFAPYLQHPIMQTGLLAVQTASHVWLAGLFLSRSHYFKVSVLSSSLLPGGGFGFSANKID